MTLERNVCYLKPCDGCDISTLPTEQGRITASQSVDYVLRQAAIVRPFPSELEVLAAIAAEEYGVQDAKAEIGAAAARAIDKECPSRAN